MDVKRLTKLAIVAAIYVVGALLQGVTAYSEELQFRVSEVLVLLCLYRKDYAWSLVIGCFLANLIGPYGIWDMIFGTAHTAISVLLIIGVAKLHISPRVKLWLASLMVLPACILVGYGLNLAYSAPIILTTLWVMLGEFVVVSVVGVPVFILLEKRKKFMETI